MIRMGLFTAATLITLLAGGCKKAQAPAVNSSTQQSTYTKDAVGAGGTLNSDGSVTNGNGTVTEPNGTIMPGRTANSAPSANGAGPVPVSPPTLSPAPAAVSAGPAPIVREPAPAPIALTAPRGTAVTIRTREEITASGGDGARFTGSLERPVVSHGAVIFERGTPVSGVVVGAKRKGEFKGSGDLSIVLTAIGSQSVHTSEYTLVNKGRGKRTGAFIGGGGGLGAIIGGIAGGGKGALIGGLAGAGAGTAASTTGSKNVIIRSETVITFRLTEPVTR